MNKSNFYTKVLILGDENYTGQISEFLLLAGCNVMTCNQPLKNPMINYFKTEKNVEVIICYRYNFSIPEEAVEIWKEKIIKLHTIYIPFNQGHEHCFWSWYDNTPFGASITRVETGQVLFRKLLRIHPNTSLSFTDHLLQYHLKKLFKKHWFKILYNYVQPIPIEELGTVHHECELCGFDKHLIEKDVTGFIVSEYGKRMRRDAQKNDQ